MKFSIIIPVYNVAPYLRECLDSVLAQTFTDWEAVCVDDGSTDGSGAILDEYAAQDSRFRVIHQENAGVAKARQVGLDAARGEYIGWVDSDDVIEPEHYASLICAADDGGYDLMWSDHVLEKDGKATIVSHKCDEDAAVLLSEILQRKQMGSLWDKIFRRAFVEKVGAGFGIGKCVIMEDNFFLSQILIANPRVKYIESSTYHYFVRNGSLSNKGGKTFWWQQVIDANNAIYALLHGRFDESVLRWRMGLFKIWMVFESNVTDEMFYGFQPEIKWLPKGICGFKSRVLFFLASCGLRGVLMRVKERVG